MTSPDLGSAFTACPDDTPKRLQVCLAPNYLRLPDCRGNCGAAINAISNASASDMRIALWDNLLSVMASAALYHRPPLLIPGWRKLKRCRYIFTRIEIESSLGQRKGGKLP